MIDLYCERTGPGLWAEPFNTVSNLSFIVAALLARRLARRSGARGTGSLVGLILAIGVGSGLWHMFAVRWAQVLDVVPTVLFQVVFTWRYARRVAGLRPFAVTGILFCMGVATVAALPFMHLLNGTLNYVSALLVPVVLGAVDVRAGRRPLLLVAAGIFLVSMGFRAIDLAVCGAMPVGTHFIWHLLNGAVLYVAMRALVLNGPLRPPA